MTVDYAGECPPDAAVVAEQGDADRRLDSGQYDDVLDHLEERPDQKGHHPSTIIVRDTVARCADPTLNAAMAKAALGQLLGDVMEHEPPTCERCGEPIHYQRGVTSHGGVSCWVHSETDDPRCADRLGECGRPADRDGGAA